MQAKAKFIAATKGFVGGHIRGTVVSELSCLGDIPRRSCSSLRFSDS